MVLSFFGEKSRLQYCQVHHKQKIKQMIDETQFPAENLEIEITEYSFA